ncbi:MFS family permease [Kitasatospora sp. MAP12-15]|uniref:MFS transporter n=1 Tax=unclassified Kitasatospora TaxID=2633591 RepID=UPI0024734AB7|nr:MFS transporter [Kitasatospora sp. MAP12-44]MDH6114570.1 MFS family permease [Kitasatospora sp. MAP12-44]
MNGEAGDGAIDTIAQLDTGDGAEPAATEQAYMPLRQIGQFVAGRGLAGLGDQFLLFAIPLLAYKLTGSASKTGLIFLIEWLPRVLFLPVAGVLADRFRGYFLYLGADSIRAALALTAFAMMYLVPGAQFATLSVLVAGMSLASAQSYVALEASLPRFVPMDQMIRAQSIVQGTEQTSEVLGPVLAALLSSVLPTTALLAVIGTVYALTTLNTFTLRRWLRVEVLGGAVTEPTTLRSVATGVAEGAGTLRRLPAILGLVGLTMTVNLMVGVGMSTSAALTSGTFHEPDRYFGILTTSAGVVGILTFFVVPKLTKSLNPLVALTLSYGLICLGGFGISQATTFTQFAVSYSVLIGSIGFFNVFIRMERVKRIPREHFAKTIGIIILLNQASLPLAGLLVTSFATTHDPRSVVLGSVVGSVCIAVLLIPLLTRLRYLHAHPDSAPNHQ